LKYKQNHKVVLGLTAKRYKNINSISWGVNLRYYGLGASTFEINDDPIYQDMLSPMGFCFALSLCVRLFKQAPHDVSFAHQIVMETHQNYFPSKIDK